jgi:hypothetical protein
MKHLKRLWNRFVEGFETGVWNVSLFILGLADDQEIMSLQAYLPEKTGKIFMGIAVIGILLRYFIKMGWIRPFKEEE